MQLKVYKFTGLTPLLMSNIESVNREIPQLKLAPSNFDQFLEELLRVWNRAGRMAGIGAWRPEKQGRHGRYEVSQQK